MLPKCICANISELFAVCVFSKVRQHCSDINTKNGFHKSTSEVGISADIENVTGENDF